MDALKFISGHSGWASVLCAFCLRSTFMALVKTKSPTSKLYFQPEFSPVFQTHITNYLTEITASVTSNGTLFFFILQPTFHHLQCSKSLLMAPQDKFGSGPCSHSIISLFFFHFQHIYFIHQVWWILPSKHLLSVFFSFTTIGFFFFCDKL